MKTIEQEAREYAEKVTLNTGSDRTKRENAFKAGVEFAQQWISIDDELPEMHNGNSSENVLVKTQEGDVLIGYLYINGWFANSQYPCEITHWRSITKK